MLTRTEPFTLTALVNSTHIDDVYDARRYVSRDEASRDAREGSVVLALRIAEAQGDGMLVWHRGEELPRLLYFGT